MKKVDGKENLHEACFEETFGKSVSRITIEKISEAVPHWPLDKTVVITSGTRNGEQVQCHSDMGIARM